MKRRPYHGRRLPTLFRSGGRTRKTRRGRLWLRTPRHLGSIRSHSLSPHLWEVGRSKSTRPPRILCHMTGWSTWFWTSDVRSALFCFWKIASFASARGTTWASDTSKSHMLQHTLVTWTLIFYFSEQRKGGTGEEGKAKSEMMHQWEGGKFLFVLSHS